MIDEKVRAAMDANIEAAHSIMTPLKQLILASL